jgi:glycosyltransferase involved in cell wall biosynthesis
MIDVVIPFSPAHTPHEMLDRARDSVHGQKVQTNIILIEDEEGAGPAWARNQGLKKSSERYVAFLDADDHWRQKKLYAQLDAIQRENAAISITQTENTNYTHNINSFSNEKKLVKDIVLGKSSSFTSSILIDRRKTDVMFNEEIYRREDHLFVLEAICDGGIAYVPEPLTLIEKHDRGLSQAGSPGKQLDAHAEFLAKATDLYPWLTEEVYLFERRFWREKYHRAGRGYHYQGEYDKAASYLWQSLREVPHHRTLAAFVIASFYSQLK